MQVISDGARASSCLGLAGVDLSTAWTYYRTMIKNEEILKLLQKHIDTRIETVAVQGMDSLDFRDVFIGSLVTLVKKAYAAGHGQGYEEALEAAEDMAVRHAKEGRN